MSSPLDGGRTVGRYRILDLLGAGAMGEVYLAEDPQIDRRLAIKTVRLVGRPQEVEERKRRLLREARAAGRLLHPNVVTLFDAGEDQGFLFLAFELIEGTDLAGRLEKGPALSLREVLRIVRQTAEALDYAHRQGIVHRDIKPSNILLDLNGRVKVADFGIAKMAGQSTELTMAGSVMGSPQYLSPEQIRGEELDGRSDIFSLGVLLYELLSRKRPFEGDTITTLVYQILHKEPPPISELRRIPDRLELLLRRMIAKDRDERFATAAEVAVEVAEVERELADETLSAPAADLPPMEATRILPKTGGSTAPVRSVMPPPLPPLPPRPTASTLPANLPPPPPPVRTTAQTTVAPRTGRGPGVVIAIAAVLLILVVAVAAGWFLMFRKDAPETVAQTGTPATDALPQDSSLPADPGVVETPPGQEPVETATEELEAPADTETPKNTGVEAEPADTAPRTPAQPPTREYRPAEETVAPARPVPAPPTRTPDTRRQPFEPAPSVPGPAPAPVPEENGRAADGDTGRETEQPRPASAGPVTRTGLELAFRVTPPDAFVLVDGRVVGKASEWSGLRGNRTYTLPGPGEYEIKIRAQGLREHRMTVEAGETGGVTPIFARLSALGAAEASDASDLRSIRVREAVAFRVRPEGADIEVNGQAVGSARQYIGRPMQPRTWLKLPTGRHRVSVVAPGHQRQDILVEVSPGADKDRDRIEVALSPGGD